MHNSVLKYIVHVEFFIIAVAIAMFGILVGKFEWYWLLLGFIAYDITLAGYLVSPSFGKYAYNVTHSLIGPSLLAIVYIATNEQAILFIVVTWLLNISVNRALGYGLKTNENPIDTHMSKARLHKPLRRTR